MGCSNTNGIEHTLQKSVLAIGADQRDVMNALRLQLAHGSSPSRSAAAARLLKARCGGSIAIAQIGERAMKERYGVLPCIHERAPGIDRGRDVAALRLQGLGVMASLTRSASAVAPKAIAAAEAEYGTLDQLFELVAKGRVLDVVLARQGSDPAARLNLKPKESPRSDRGS